MRTQKETVGTGANLGDGADILIDAADDR